MDAAGAEHSFVLEHVSVRFGGIQALTDVSLEAPPHRVHGVIGPNGAGKTTLFNVACGFVQPQSGRLTWQEREVSRLRPHHLAELGIGRTLQGLGLFDRMSVLENVMVGAHHHARAGFLAALLGLSRSTRDERRLRERAMAALAEVGAADRADRMPSSLPFATRKRVALARALVTDPALLLLDEPASGLSNEEMDAVGALLRGLTERMSVMLVEHHMDLVMQVCDDISVLDFGRVIARGRPDEVRTDPAVLAAYLGDEVDHQASGSGQGVGPPTAPGRP